MSDEDCFASRVSKATKGHFDESMRRSIQSVALYEANRCLVDRYSSLRPFQRKIALVSTAVDLIATLDFISETNQAEAMYRTQRSKEPLAPDLAWRRMKLIEREVKNSILPKVKEMEGAEDMSHEKICHEYLQNKYEEVTKSEKPYPPNWEYSHFHFFLTYRVFYRSGDLDPDIFPASPPRVVDVPAKKPENIRDYGGRVNGGRKNSGPDARALLEANDEDRRALLAEVKGYTELLREFEGVISEDEIAKKKRALYEALPPVPINALYGAGHGGALKKRKKNKTPVKVDPEASADEDGDGGDAEGYNSAMV